MILESPIFFASIQSDYLGPVALTIMSYAYSGATYSVAESEFGLLGRVESSPL